MSTFTYSTYPAPPRVRARTTRFVSNALLFFNRASRAWESQALSFAHPEGGGTRTRSVLLDKIVR